MFQLNSCSWPIVLKNSDATTSNQLLRKIDSPRRSLLFEAVADKPSRIQAFHLDWIIGQALGLCAPRWDNSQRHG